MTQSEVSAAIDRNHPTLTVLGSTLVGEHVADGHDPFADLAEAETDLGTVYFTRAGADRGWDWSLITVQRDYGDFDYIESQGHRSLEAAVKNAERQLRALRECALRSRSAADRIVWEGDPPASAGRRHEYLKHDLGLACVVCGHERDHHAHRIGARDGRRVQF